MTEISTRSCASVGYGRHCSIVQVASFFVNEGVSIMSNAKFGLVWKKIKIVAETKSITASISGLQFRSAKIIGTLGIYSELSLFFKEDVPSIYLECSFPSP